MSQGTREDKWRSGPADGRHLAIPSATLREAYLVISSAELLERHKEIIIEHGTERYRLRITSNNKLILTK